MVMILLVIPSEIRRKKKDLNVTLYKKKTEAAYPELRKALWHLIYNHWGKVSENSFYKKKLGKICTSVYFHLRNI